MQFKAQWDIAQRNNLEQIDEKIKLMMERLVTTERDVHQKCNNDNMRIV